MKAAGWFLAGLAAGFVGAVWLDLWTQGTPGTPYDGTV